MAAGDTLVPLIPQNNLAPDWLWVAFTGGSNEPALGDVMFGDTSNAEATLEYLVLTGGAWTGDAAGYMLLSNWNGTVWTSGENLTAGSTTPADDLTITGIPATAFATVDNRNNKLVIDFDPAVNEVAMFQGFMPRHYAGGGVTLTVSWMGSTATTGDTSWAAFFMSITKNVDNIETKNFAAPQLNQAADVDSGASGIPAEFTIAFTDGAQMDNVAAGELFYLLLMRDAQDGTNDDMAGDAEIVFIEVRETP